VEAATPMSMSVAVAVALRMMLAGAVKAVPFIGVAEVEVGAAFTTRAIELEKVVVNATALSARAARQGK